MTIEIKTHTDFDMDGREFAASYDVIENGEVVFSGFTCALDADLLADLLRGRAASQEEVARLRGALGELSNQPFALYDGEKWYADEEAAICSCANMQNLQKVFLESQLDGLNK